MANTSTRRVGLGLVLSAIVALGEGCPKLPAKPPPVPETGAPNPAEPIPPPVKRPEPPGEKGDVPEVPPPVKP